MFTDVFRGQSRLLAHVYSLNRLLASAGANDVEHLGPAAVGEVPGRNELPPCRRVRAASAHLRSALRSLPRRFWAYRETEPNPADKTAWAGESGELLQQTLLLDGMLTELLSAPRLTIDASSASPSPGQLLHRIRSGISRLRNHPRLYNKSMDRFGLVRGVVCLLLLAANLAAQRLPSGRIVGQVVDADQNPLEGVEVRLINLSTAKSIVAHTDLAGDFLSRD